MADDLEQAVADIQFLGSPELIGLVRIFSEECARKDEVNLNNVMAAIRTELRKELGEKPVSDEIFVLLIPPHK